MINRSRNENNIFNDRTGPGDQDDQEQRNNINAS